MTHKALPHTSMLKHFVDMVVVGRPPDQPDWSLGPLEPVAGLWVPVDHATLPDDVREHIERTVSIGEALTPTLGLNLADPIRLTVGSLDYLRGDDPLPYAVALSLIVGFDENLHPFALFDADALPEVAAQSGAVPLQRLSLLVTPAGDFAYSLHPLGQPVGTLVTELAARASETDLVRGPLQWLLASFAQAAALPRELPGIQACEFVLESMVTQFRGIDLDDFPLAHFTISRSAFSDGFVVRGETLPATETAVLNAKALAVKGPNHVYEFFFTALPDADDDVDAPIAAVIHHVGVNRPGISTRLERAETLPSYPDEDSGLVAYIGHVLTNQDMSDDLVESAGMQTCGGLIATHPLTRDGLVDAMTDFMALHTEIERRDFERFGHKPDDDSVTVRGVPESVRTLSKGLAIVTQGGRAGEDPSNCGEFLSAEERATALKMTIQWLNVMCVGDVDACIPLEEVPMFVMAALGQPRDDLRPIVEEALFHANSPMRWLFHDGP